MVNNLSKKILALLMTLAIVMSLMPAMTLSASAAPITGSTDISNAQTVPEGSTEVMTRYDVPLYYKFIPTTTASYTITTSGGIPEVCYMGTLYNVPNTASALAQGGDLSGHVSISYNLTQDVTYYIGLLNDSEPSTSCMLNIAVANTAPTVTTQAVSDITQTTAKGNGNITVLGTPNPTQYGVVWGTSANPTTALSTKTTQGAASSTGAFTSSITGLTAGTTYHVRAYATNSAGTSYGEDVTFTTDFAPPTVTGISPMSGRTAGGTIVTITGTNLTGATAVKFGTTNASSYTVNSATQITATSPAGSIGNVDITVTTPGGSSATGSGDRFSYYGTASTVNEKYAFEGDNSKTFTEGGLTFNITGSYLHVEQNVGWGYDDNLYVDNSDNPLPGAGVIGSFKCTTSDFNVHSLYLITLNSATEILQYNNILIRGKLDGTEVFTHRVPFNSINTTEENNYYTYIDLSSCSDHVIDELEFEVEHYESDLVQYLMIDDFSFNQVITSAAPTVTDANISISGGTGTGGAYKIGDTVTATWNNTVAGDNNSAEITSVTVDFTQFGGGSSVAATNNSGIWTATYTIVAGNIDATNRNVSVTATDAASSSTVVADTTNSTVDNIAPTVSVSSTTSTSTNTSPITVTIEFSENVTGFTVEDITVGNGIKSNFSGSGESYTVDITPSAQGPVTVDVAANIAQDDAGNNNTAATQLSRTYDSKAPTIGVVSNGGLYNVTVSPTFDEGSATLSKDGGTANSFASGTSIAAEGSYVLVVTDTASNSTTASFTIDKTAPTVAGVVNDANYNTSVAATFTEVTATLSQNAGVAKEYNSGDSIDDSGSYVLVVTDTAGNSTTVNFIIDKTAPVITNSGTILISTVAATNGTTICALTATDATSIPGFSDALIWSVTGGVDAGKFSVDGTNLNINNSGGLSDGSYIVQATVTDKAGNSDEETITVKVVNGPTVSPANQSYDDTESEDTFENKTGTISATANSGSITGYGINGGTTGSTEIGGITYNVSKAGTYGTLYVKSDDGKYVYVPTNNAKLNEQKDTVTDIFTIEATDAAGTAGNSLTITINGVNDTPTGMSLSANSINENVASNTTIGTLSSTDVDAGNTFTYSLVSGDGSADNTSFNIDGTSLRISSSPNYETKSNYSVRIRTTDQGGLYYEKAFTITINNLNESPTNISLSANSINENVASNTTIATLSSTDVDTGNTFTYSLVSGNGSADNTSFNIDGTSLRISSSPNYETKSSYSVRVRTTDQDGLYFEKAFTITINDLHESPTNISLSVNSINENVAANTTIGTLSSTDADTGNTFTYSLVSGNGSADNTSFNIDGTSLRISSSPNYETKSSYSVRIRTTDQGGLYYEEAFTISISDINEAPIISLPDTISIVEGSKTVFTAAANDAEGNDITWSITGGADCAKFRIVADTGVISFVNAPSFSAPTDADTNNSYILEITASDGTLTAAKIVTITITQQASNGGDTTAGSTVVEVNGQKQDAGTSTTQTTGDQTVTTIKVDDLKLSKILDASGEKPTVTLPSSGNSDVVVGELNGQTVKNMETRDATLQIRTDTVSYTLPASQINIDAVSHQMGSQLELKDIKVNVKIANSSANTVKTVEDTAKRGNYQIVVKPLDFEITCTSGEKTIEISRFNGYVERTVAIPDGIDPSKITTGIVLNPDGSFRHVPTEIIVLNGKYFAKINSLSNSTYSVIFNALEFADVSSHWAKDAINDMGSRMVVTGVGNNSYEPDRSITRAEFAAIVVRAMGLQKGTTESTFEDVTLTDWFNGYVDTATAYSLINGYDSNSFGPNDTITREQAITILSRAIKITGLNIILSDSEVSELLSKYTDGGLVSDYAKTGVAACVKAGVISGTTPTTISPKDYVTRAEVAMMAQRMLQKSGLI